MSNNSIGYKSTKVGLIPSDWKEVEIIGWLYQYYIADKKDELIKAKKKYKDNVKLFEEEAFMISGIYFYIT
jgi:hypothetical protein